MLSEDPRLVLLVDRDADTRQMYAVYLQSAHYATDQAEDGRTALAKALTSHPEVIVTETRLPGISGYDLARVLRDDRDAKDIRIIFLTGDGYASDLARAEATGADAVLVKPCLPAVLAQAISRLFSKGAEVRERSDRAIAKAALKLEVAKQTVERTRASREMLSHTHRRRDTTTPPLTVPNLRCVQCDAPLRYVKSYIGGVSVKQQEQWDYFECVNGCGTFQYRQRTRTVRRLA